MLLKRVLKRTALGAAVAWAVFSWATGKIDPAGGVAKVYSVVAEKVGRKGSRPAEPTPQQDVAATRAAATVKAAGIGPGSKPGAVGGYSANDVLCLAHAVYYEARNESRELQIAVAQVALNRALSTTGQKSICRIIYLGLGRPMGCLFYERRILSCVRPPSRYMVSQSATMGRDPSLLKKKVPKEPARFHRS